jgi:hypothetical protein
MSRRGSDNSNRASHHRAPSFVDRPFNRSGYVQFNGAGVGYGVGHDSDPTRAPFVPTIFERENINGMNEQCCVEVQGAGAEKETRSLRKRCSTRRSFKRPSSTSGKRTMRRKMVAVSYDLMMHVMPVKFSEISFECAPMSLRFEVCETCSTMLIISTFFC